MNMKMMLLTAITAVSMSMTAFASSTTTYETEVTNGISIGDIRISLAEYELDSNGNETAYQDNKVVVPGQTVDKIVKVTNEANTAWIRMKIEYSSEDGIQGMSDSMVTIPDENWVKIGDYYYYIEPVEKGETLTFIDTATVPYVWTEDYQDLGFQIIITAEAVQEANFTPDFNSDDPWFGTLIETCVHTEYEYVQADPLNFEVVFEGKSEGFVKVGDDFFSNFGEMMPGDTWSDTVTIASNYSRPIWISFRTEVDETNDDIVASLLADITLTITNGGEVIYSGSLSATDLVSGILLGKYSKGESTEFTYTLEVPAEFNNAYALSAAKVRWIFSTSISSGSSGSSSGSGGGSTRSSGTTTVTTEPATENITEDDSDEIKSGTVTANYDSDVNSKDGLVDRFGRVIFPKSGDDFNPLLTGGIWLGALAIVAWLLLGKKKKERKDKE